MDIPRRRQGIHITFHKQRLESPLEECTNAVVTLVEPRRVPRVDQVNGPGQITAGCLQQQMVVIVHQAVRMDNRPKSLPRQRKQVQKLREIPVVNEDGTLLHPAVHHVVPGTWELNTQISRHDVLPDRVLF